MVLPVKKPVNNGDAMQKLKLFSEHLFSHFINLVVMYGVHLDHEPIGLDSSSIVISGTIIKCPASTLNAVSQRLRDLAKMFGVTIIPNRRTITDVRNALRTVNVTAPTAEVLINASRQIFLSYERLLMSLKNHELPTYAKEAAEKILKFYVNPSTDPTFTEQMITTAVISNKTDDRNIVQCCFGDLFTLFFNFQTDATRNKMARKFSKAGIYCDKKIYSKDGLDVKKYYYRRLCDTESTEIISENYHLDRNLPDMYEFVLHAENKDQQMNDLREYFKTRNVTDFNLNNNLEVIQKKILDEIKSVIGIYHLEHLEKLKDSLDAIENKIKHPSSPSTSCTGNASAGSSSGMIRTTMESNSIGNFNQNIRGGSRQIETTLRSNKVKRMDQDVGGKE